MTTIAARAAIHAQIVSDIRRCNEAPARAAHREDAVWESWLYLFQTGQYAKARQWWIEEIQPTFQQQ